jgi:hypothetical protein
MKGLRRRWKAEGKKARMKIERKRRRLRRELSFVVVERGGIDVDVSEERGGLALRQF